MSGEPCFAGTRVPVRALLDYIEGGETLNEFLDRDRVSVLTFRDRDRVSVLTFSVDGGGREGQLGGRSGVMIGSGVNRVIGCQS